nr:immunoglobulin light chain junction region [Macaca mulatta]MOX77823.1 immunoglobulin light chain junction region [Macaca mulatta]MOX77972.1 immunoglobulin light chain junction region [Macaca mulatta]MOX78005.1 immunoglobulin light chain junction region [Macaca mulatta]MOX78027.1 immunoglobulin light chain junction region [Macaca mulatta]
DYYCSVWDSSLSNMLF